MSQKIETVRPLADRNNSGKWISWAADGGLVNLPDGAANAVSVRVILTGTGRCLGNGKPVYTATPAPDEVKERFDSERGGIVATRTSTNWLGQQGEGVKTPRSLQTREGAAVPAPAAYVLQDATGNQQVIRVERQFIPAEKEFFSATVAYDHSPGGSIKWIRDKWDAPPPSPEMVLRVGYSHFKGRYQEISRSAPIAVTDVIAWVVSWPMTGRFIKAKIATDTRVEAFVRLDSGKVVSATGTWGELAAETREQLLRRYPTCPACGKVRFDATRGANACGKCLSLNDHLTVIEPFLQRLDPTVNVSQAATGESLLFRFGDEKVSYRFRKGYGFEWDEAAQALKGGKKKMDDIWDRIRPVPEEVVAEVAAVLGLLGLTVQVNPSEPREVFVRGAWVDSLGRARGAFGLKGTKNSYHVNGVEGLETLRDAVLTALRGQKCPVEMPVVDDNWMPVPAPPAGWVHEWWTK